MKNLFPKKYLSIALVGFLALAIFISSTGVTLAQTTGPTLQQAGLASTQTPSSYSCNMFFGDPCTAFVVFVLNFVTATMNLLIAIGGWFITIGMALTTTVYSSQATQSGFAATLSLANLAFVLAMIIIAVATILHSETYGYKKALWRLVVMAILVNFGLVITAPIVGFANSMTNYFVAAVPGGGNGNSASAVVTFSNTLMQKTNAAALQGTIPQGAPGASPASGLFQVLLSLVFIIIFQGLIALTFLALGLLLFVRYIFLVVLLIMLPLAWVTWIFPSLSGQWSKWWKNFFHWTFFPPAAMFFVYLATIINTNFSNTVNAGNSPAAAIGNATGLAAVAGGASTGILANMVNSIVVIGIMIGGLLAASKLAGEAGSFAVNQAKNVTGAVQGWAGRKGKRALTYPLRTQIGRNMTEKVQGLGLNSNRLVRTLTHPVREVGVATAKLRAPGEKQVGDEHKNYDKLSYEEQARRFGTANNPGQLAILENLTKAQKSKDIKVQAAANKALATLPADLKNRLERLKLLYGKGAPLPIPQGARTETFGEGKSKAQSALEKERDKVAKEGGNTSELDEAIKEFTEAQEESTEAERESTRATKKATAAAKKPPAVTIKVEDLRSQAGGARFEAGAEGVKDAGSNPAGPRPPLFRGNTQQQDPRFEAGPDGVKDVKPNDNS